MTATQRWKALPSTLVIAILVGLGLGLVTGGCGASEPLRHLSMPAVTSEAAELTVFVPGAPALDSLPSAWTPYAAVKEELVRVGYSVVDDPGEADVIADVTPSETRASSSGHQVRNLSLTLVDK